MGSLAAEREILSDDRGGLPDRLQSPSTDFGVIPRAGAIADSGASSVPPQLLTGMPSQGSLCANIVPLQALELQSGNGDHTSVVIRQHSTTLVTNRVPKSKQPLLLEGKLSSAIANEGPNSWQDIWYELESEWPSTEITGFQMVSSSNALWNIVAQTEPRRLLTMVLGFPNKSQLLQVLSGDILVAWSAV